MAENAQPALSQQFIQYLLSPEVQATEAQSIAAGLQKTIQIIKPSAAKIYVLSDPPSGVAMQVYAALIASVLIASRTGLRPTKRTFEMIQFYLSGWATLKEVEAHLIDRRAKESPS